MAELRDCVFFFQAEDGIRDYKVTGVQTCALPISSKPETTRNRIQGIVTKPQGQIVFIDTPGLHEADSALGRQMMQEVAAALEGIDVLLLMVDASRMHPRADDLLLEKAKRFRGKTILALNKVDRLPKPKLLPLIDAFAKDRK